MTTEPLEVLDMLARGGKATVHAPSRRLPETSTMATESSAVSGQGHRLEPVVKEAGAPNPVLPVRAAPS
jgi:hypothetical protein